MKTLRDLPQDMDNLTGYIEATQKRNRPDLLKDAESAENEARQMLIIGLNWMEQHPERPLKVSKDGHINLAVAEIIIEWQSFKPSGTLVHTILGHLLYIQAESFKQWCIEIVKIKQERNAK